LWLGFNETKGSQSNHVCQSMNEWLGFKVAEPVRTI
jgi:hypothetical protein